MCKFIKNKCFFLFYYFILSSFFIKTKNITNKILKNKKVLGAGVLAGLMGITIAEFIYKKRKIENYIDKHGIFEEYFNQKSKEVINNIYEGLFFTYGLYYNYNPITKYFLKKEILKRTIVISILDKIEIDIDFLKNIIFFIKNENCNFFIKNKNDPIIDENYNLKAVNSKNKKMLKNMSLDILKEIFKNKSKENLFKYFCKLFQDIKEKIIERINLIDNKSSKIEKIEEVEKLQKELNENDFKEKIKKIKEYVEKNNKELDQEGPISLKKFGWFGRIKNYFGEFFARKKKQ